MDNNNDLGGLRSDKVMDVAEPKAAVAIVRARLPRESVLLIRRSEWLRLCSERMASCPRLWISMKRWKRFGFLWMCGETPLGTASELCRACPAIGCFRQWI